MPEHILKYISHFCYLNDLGNLYPSYAGLQLFKLQKQLRWVYGRNNFKCVGYMQFKSIILGGTFDRLHKGHQKMLSTAFERGEHVWIGVTSQVFLSTIDIQSAKRIGPIQVYEERLRAVTDYLQNKGWLKRATLLAIDDKWGTTLTDRTLEAIVVSPETELVATEINLLRAQKNWSALEVILVPWVLARDKAPIHSIRIRSGEIDREGNLFKLLPNWGVRQLPKPLRSELKQPMGELFIDTNHNHEEAVIEFVKKFAVSLAKPDLAPRDSSQFAAVKDSQEKSAAHCSLPTANSRFLVSVGDAVTDALLKIGVIPDVSIVDLQIQRKQVYKNVTEIGFRGDFILETVKNPAGTVSYAGFHALIRLINRVRQIGNHAVLQVIGEEDLFTLLALFVAPLGSLIVYGQPGTIRSPAMPIDNQSPEKEGEDRYSTVPVEAGYRMVSGIVVIEVTEGKKQLARKYLEQFEK